MKIPPPNQTQIIVDLIKSGRYNPEELSPIPLPSLPACLNELMRRHGVTSSDALAELAGVHRSTVFRILSEKNHPSRSMLLCFAFVLKLSYEETQVLLKCGNWIALSSSSDRDLLIIDALIKEKPLGVIDELLVKKGFEPIVKS